MKQLRQVVLVRIKACEMSQLKRRRSHWRRHDETDNDDLPPLVVHFYFRDSGLDKVHQRTSKRANET